MLDDSRNRGERKGNVKGEGGQREAKSDDVRARKVKEEKEAEDEKERRKKKVEDKPRSERGRYERCK